MTERDIIHHYLTSLSKYLSRLEKQQADEVIREIESHIYDVLEQQEQSGQTVDAAAILQGFGSPRELATQYVEHVRDGAPPPFGFRAIQKVKKGVTTSLYLAMGIFGFGTSLALLMLGIAKCITPSEIGVWSESNGNSIMIAFVEHPYINTDELLGYWLIPVAIGLGLAIGYLTLRVLDVLKSHG